MVSGVKRPALVIGLLSVLLSARILASPTDLSRQAISIPADDLVTSLDRIARQMGIELVYNADQLKGIQTQAVSGSFTAREVVLKLLEGTNLTVIEHPNGAMLITLRPAEPGSRSDAPNDPRRGPTPTANTTGRRPDSCRPECTQNPTGSLGLTEIVVTGTHIRDQAPIGSALLVYSRGDMERSGSGTLDQFARQIQQNFTGADTIATAPNTNAGLGGFQQGATKNIFGGAGFNLNGLGPGSTLTLLNGHRLAAGASDGSIVDMSQIPLSAIDHIEVLDDGASAIYGSDAVAGVVNIVTRREFEGAETGIRYAQATDGGAQETTASQLFGHAWGSGNVLSTYEYDDQRGLDASQRSWINPQAGAVSLIPSNRRNSLFASASQAISSGMTLSANALYSHRDFDNAGVLEVANQLARQRSSGQVDQSTVILSLDHDFSQVWHLNVAGDYSSIRQREHTLSDPSPTFQLDDTETEQFTANSSIKSVDALLGGSLLRLPGGTVKLSLGASYRTEGFNSQESQGLLTSPIALTRNVASAYGEIIIPFVGKSNPLAGVRRFDMSVAYRFDDYSDTVSRGNPKIGFLWEPLADLQVRGTYGTSFQAPRLSQLGAPSTTNTILVPDTGAVGGVSDILVINGGNPHLRPEQSTSVTAGIDYRPSSSPFNGSLTYFNVLFKNQIQSQNITSLGQALFTQPLLSPFFALNPALADVESYFSSPGFRGDYAGRGPAAVAAIFNNQLANLATTEQAGLRLSAQYRLPTQEGEFNVWLTGTHFLRDRVQAAVYVPWYGIDNTVGEPPSSKLNGGVGWTAQGLASGLTLNYVNSYRNTLLAPSQRVSAWTTLDWYLAYDTGMSSSTAFSHWKVALTVQNLADRRPPYLQIPAADLAPGQSAIPFDGTNASPVGRLMALQVTKHW